MDEGQLERGRLYTWLAQNAIVMALGPTFTDKPPRTRCVILARMDRARDAKPLMYGVGEVENAPLSALEPFEGGVILSRGSTPIAYSEGSVFDNMQSRCESLEQRCGALEGQLAEAKTALEIAHRAAEVQQQQPDLSHREWQLTFNRQLTTLVNAHGYDATACYGPQRITGWLAFLTEKLEQAARVPELQQVADAMLVQRDRETAHAVHRMAERYGWLSGQGRSDETAVAFLERLFAERETVFQGYRKATASRDDSSTAAVRAAMTLGWVSGGTQRWGDFLEAWSEHVAKESSLAYVRSYLEVLRERVPSLRERHRTALTAQTWWAYILASAELDVWEAKERYAVQQTMHATATKAIDALFSPATIDGQNAEQGPQQPAGGTP